MSTSPNLETVRQRRAELAKLRKQIDAEDDDLAIAERALKRLSGKPNGKAPKRVLRANGHKRRPKRLSQREMVIETLRGSAADWVENAADLHALVQGVHGVDIPKTSFQPLLSFLKNEGVIKRDGQRVALAERVR